MANKNNQIAVPPKPYRIKKSRILHTFSGTLGVFHPHIVNATARKTFLLDERPRRTFLALARRRSAHLDEIAGGKTSRASGVLHDPRIGRAVPLRDDVVGLGREGRVVYF